MAVLMSSSTDVNAIDADTSSGCFLDFPDGEVLAVLFSCQSAKDDQPAESTSTVSTTSTKVLAEFTTVTRTVTTTSGPVITTTSSAPAEASSAASSSGTP